MATPPLTSSSKENKSQFKTTQQIYHKAADGDNDAFYHIKQCYQSVPKTKTKTSQCAATSCTPYHLSIAFAPTAYSLLLHATNAGAGTICSGSSSAVMWRRWLIVVCMLLCHTSMSVMAAPQSCILCDKNDLLAKDPHTDYEEYLFEHQVTRHDAINALKQLNESFYEGIQSDSSCNAVRCTEKVNNYCISQKFINDHCWCEFGHSTEGLPFVPHICYMGEKTYKASVGSCFFYEEVKECCCSSLLAKEWRHISAASSLHRNSQQVFCNYLTLVIAFLYLLIRRIHFY